jgi:hypothetical protein
LITLIVSSLGIREGKAALKRLLTRGEAEAPTELVGFGVAVLLDLLIERNKNGVLCNIEMHVRLSVPFL